MTLRFPVFRSLLLAGAGLACLAPAIPAHAQEVISREVVQPLPSEEVQRLNRALVALAKAPRDLDALVEAGTAAMGVEDLEAAVGFFGRAAEIDPNNPRVALGLGTVYLRSGRPAEAIPQFDRARAAGVPAREVLSNQALAFDLIGDQTSAQAAYARALELDPANDEARRRLAVSQAISGNRARFEEALRPLLDKRDTAAFRARAFGLAILGDQERAAAIVEQVMPRDLSSRVVPYLAYMPRLTAAQQAAAANLGIFPRAADIGREDPRLARFAAEERAADRLAPAGEPLGGPAPAPAGTGAAPRPAVIAPATPQSQPQPQRVADAFSDLGAAPPPGPKVGAGAVDLSRITVKREAPPPPPKPKEPPKPVNPSRVWVQVATGKKVDALGYDWRRISRKGGDLLAKFKAYTTPWGEANRLLAGPVESREKAQALVGELKAKGLDSFLYVSPEGEEIQPLK